MPRHEDQQRVRHLFEHLPVRLEYLLFLFVMRTRGDPNGPLSQISFAKFPPSLDQVIRYLDVELDVAGNACTLRSRSERTEAFCVRFALCRDDDAVRQGFPEKR